MEAKIEIISREFIKPSSPTPQDSKEQKLSLLDQCTPQVYMRLLFFYQNQPKVLDPTKTALNLKQSLSECLTKFYPLAGKLNEDRSSIDCDDSGVLFVEAKVDASLSEPVRSSPYEHFGQYLPFDHQGASGSETKLFDAYPRNEILLAIQVSWFECGGSAIGVSMSHAVGDLMSLVAFMNSWAAINRGEIAKILVPNFDLGRNLFPPRDSPYKFPLAEVEGKIVCKRFVFGKEKLTEVKELASSIGLKDPTRVEVVTAFLLKQFVNLERAKKNCSHNSCSTAKTRFMVWHAVNLRSRISSLAAEEDNFTFGNVSNIATASFIPDDDDSRDYGDLVLLTRTAIRNVNENYVLNLLVPFLNSFDPSSLREQEAATKAAAGAEQQPTEKMKLILFSSWCLKGRFSASEADFGWGKPVSVGPAGTRNTATTRVLLTSSSSSDDGIAAWIYMVEDELALLPDELLSLAATDFFPLDELNS
ncbi:OLC1v1031715C1 [Oldenlandia corymbosa var. corymbosa]|uniref:OLC1v1031715C1 n=1 Tax=Oldenlandia corymbosa var. corymbosa TaxID=529605 RepID=A0AAV1CJ30_OLDCO|nr:OLC1v1031715C1 [Oldenlandia corymbosa var. corymbosa]